MRLARASRTLLPRRRLLLTGGATHPVPFASVLLCLALALSGCEGTRLSDRDVNHLQYADVQRMRAAMGPRLVMVDVRPPDRFAQEHIAGAVNVPLPELTPRHPALRRAETVIVYSQDWQDPLSLAAAKRLIGQGYDNVYDFRGGLTLWKRQGGNVTTDATPSPF